jgi:hypothetical protein
VGVVPDGVDINPHRAAAGDAVLVSGDIGVHGVAVMSCREGLEFGTTVASDTAPLHGLVSAMLATGADLHVLRDPTRGGVAAALNEIAKTAAVGVELVERDLPIPAEVRDACSLLGLDPLQVANEGKLLAFVPADRADEVLAAMCAHPNGAGARRIGTCVSEHPAWWWRGPRWAARGWSTCRSASSCRGSADMSERGTLLFARYAYPPNELGYCGPDGAPALLRADSAEIARRARRFEGAWSYLEFIARSAGIADPLDEAVVEAYWIGNDLLDRVDSAGLVAWLRGRFAGQVGGTWADADGRAVAHHSFQVFEVYPWAAMLRRNASPVAVSVLDRAGSGPASCVRCTVRRRGAMPAAGVGRGHARSWTGGDEVVRWSAGGRSLLAGLSAGDRVALHWDWVCDVITDEQAARIDAYEQRQRAPCFRRPPDGTGRTPRSWSCGWSKSGAKPRKATTTPRSRGS